MDRIARREGLGQDIQHGINLAGHLGKDGKGPLRQYRREGQSGQVGLTGQPQQVSLSRTEMTGQDLTAMTELWIRLPGKAAGSGQLGQDNRVRTVGPGQPRRTALTG
jgi:hypothetical protein